MKQRTSFILKGLISLVLSLVMLCGTAVTSLSAVTVDIAQTGAAEEITSGTPSSTNAPYIAGAADSTYQLVYESNKWYIKNSSNQYLKATVSGDARSGWTITVSFESSGDALSVGQANSSGVPLTMTKSIDYGDKTVYLSYADGTFTASQTSNRVRIFSGTASYKVTFHSNYGTDTTTTQTDIEPNTDTTLTANSFTREGYNFAGWNTAANGSGTSYADGATVNLSANLDLYAQWVEKPAVEPNTLYFTCPTSWTDLWAYMWKGDHKNANFPGARLTYVKQNPANTQEAIYSIEADPDEYEYIIFNYTYRGENNPNNTTPTAQTVNIKIEDALANGAGVYITDNVTGTYNYHVACYSYGYTPSTGDTNTITYKKQIEKQNPSNADEYNYRLHLTADGSKLKDTTTVTTNETTGIVLLIDMAGDFNATWGTENNRPVSKDTIINRYVNKYLSTYSTNSKVDISVIAVKGVQSEKYDSDNVTKILSKWNNYNAIDDSTFKAEEVHFGSNYTAGLMRGGEYVTENTSFDNKSIVFITNSDPLFGCNDDGTYYSGEGAGTASVARNNVLTYMDKFFTDYPTTNLYMIDVPNESTGIHETSQQMGAKAKEAGRGDFTTASNADELDTAIGNAIDKILSGDKTKNITITDTLSKYVAFASSKNLTATLYTGYNSTTQTWSNSVDFTESSPELTVSGNTVTFSRADEIEGPFKLEIAFNIKTADGVLQDTDTYGSSGYPNTGDADTDYTTATSAEKRGYYANSSATISYNLNGTTVNGAFIKPVVQAPAEPPVQGAYIFKYADRNATNNEPNRTVTVPVTLNSSEKNGYSGNGGQEGVPTFLWTTEAQTLFDGVNPLVQAALTVQGHIEEDWKNVSVYKSEIVWNNLVATEKGSNIEYNTSDHSVTITADVTPRTYMVNFYTVSDGAQPVELAHTENPVPYGQVVTFLEKYNGSQGCTYISGVDIPSGFTYWSSDPEGNFLLTTNPTFGMVIRGNVNEPDADVVNVYLQTREIPSSEPWKPEFEEAKLTYSNDDDTAEQKYYADYLANYFSVDGTAVQDLLADGKSVKYGIIVVKNNKGLADLEQSKMIEALGIMRDVNNNYSSVYLNKDKTRVAYRYEYNDASHISNFNRTWYTLTASQETMTEKKLSAMAYIEVGGEMYYSAVNYDLATVSLSN